MAASIPESRPDVYMQSRCSTSPFYPFLHKVAESFLHPHRLIRLVHQLILQLRLGIQDLLLLLELLVQAGEHGAEGDAADDGDAEHARHDTVAAAEAVGLEVPDVGARNVAELTESIDEGDGDGALGGGTGEGGADPRVEDDESAKCQLMSYIVEEIFQEEVLPSVGSCLEEESDVTSGDDLSAHADDESDQADADGTDNVPELLLVSVGAPSDDEREDARKQPRRRAHQQRGHIVEAKSSGESRLFQILATLLARIWS